METWGPGELQRIIEFWNHVSDVPLRWGKKSSREAFKRKHSSYLFLKTVALLTSMESFHDISKKRGFFSEFQICTCSWIRSNAIRTFPFYFHICKPAGDPRKYIFENYCSTLQGKESLGSPGTRRTAWAIPWSSLFQARSCEFRMACCWTASSTPLAFTMSLTVELTFQCKSLRAIEMLTPICPCTQMCSLLEMSNSH